MHEVSPTYVRRIYDACMRELLLILDHFCDARRSGTYVHLQLSANSIQLVHYSPGASVVFSAPGRVEKKITLRSAICFSAGTL